MNDYGELVLVVIGVIVIGFLVLVFKGVSCANKADSMGMKWSFGITTGCMVEHKPGRWIDIEKYRVMD